jgi:uncharacterized protein YqjF (DUF2071 family)
MSHPSLQHLTHRPWPLPTGRWAWLQSWLDLAFLHWPFEPTEVAALLPPGVEIDTFEGRAWVAVVPFRMTLQRRGLPALPGAGRFAEINVRTYVRHHGKPGVWFFSLDAASGLAVWGGRRFFHLPYHRAAIELVDQGGMINYTSRRRGPSGARFAATYHPTGEVAPAPPGSLEHWLTERYCLFSHNHQRGWHCGEIHHEPWPLQTARADIKENSMLEPLGLALPDLPPLVHFARRIDVVLWGLRRATKSGPTASTMDATGV